MVLNPILASQKEETQWLAHDTTKPFNVRIAKLYVTTADPNILFCSVDSSICGFLISLVYHLTRRLSYGSSAAPTRVCVIVYFQKHQRWAYLPWASINVEA